ncbi:MAG: RNA 2',3'-cyclic phosphodiesterase [Methanobrevibacter sp.]|jgi:2'-5' RNA ligase|nr:RNA 2',3'-cyclic phosphodiesterase [Methanobrevibacter sp.]
MKTEKYRGFLAIDITDENIVNNINKFQNELKKANANIRYVNKENLHFTLKFFGKIDSKQIYEISKVVKETINDFKPFKIAINGTGVFPNESNMKIIYVGISESRDFLQLQKTLDKKFETLGFKLEKKHIGHLTVGRLKNLKNKKNVREIIKEFEEREIGELTISKISLKKSELTSDGPNYTDLEVFEL